VDPLDDDSDVEWGQGLVLPADDAGSKGSGSAGGGRKRPSGVAQSAWERLLGVGGGEGGDQVVGSGTGVRQAQKRVERKRKSGVALAEDSEEDEEGGASGTAGSSSVSSEEDAPARRAPKRRKPARNKEKAVEVSSEDDGDDGDEDEDMGVDVNSTQSSRDEIVTDNTPLSSSPGRTAQAAAEKTTADAGGEDEDDDLPAAKPAARARPRARAGFIVDSSDEE
jgi:replication fork protection complex subunit Tof1/Swi1